MKLKTSITYMEEQNTLLNKVKNSKPINKLYIISILKIVKK